MNWPQFTWWDAFGFVGQAMFFGRFLVQWIASERSGRSVVPIHFWILSLFGSVIILVYSIYLKNVVFIAGQSVGSFIYLRNLALIRREARKSRE